MKVKSDWEVCQNVMTSVICKLLLHLAGGAEKHFEITEKNTEVSGTQARNDRLEWFYSMDECQMRGATYLELMILNMLFFYAQ